MQIKARRLVLLGMSFSFLFLSSLWWFQTTSTDVYNTKHVPSATCDSSSASLDMQHALAFILSDGRLGYVYFDRANSYSGDYVMRLCEKLDYSTKSAESHGTLRMRGIVFWGKPQMPSLSHKGKTLFYWTPPANLFFSENVSKVTLIRRDELNLLARPPSNIFEWVSVVVTPL